MASIEIALANGHKLTSVRPGDAADFVRLLADGEVAGFIPALPQPYTLETAEWWIRHRSEFLEKAGAEINFVIRNADDRVIGSVGVDDLVPGTTHHGELGYWLGREHRGRGIGRAAVNAFVDYAFAELALDRLTAHTLHFNRPSVELLRDVGFVLEGRLREYTRAASGLCDTFVFGLLKREWKGRAHAAGSTRRSKPWRKPVVLTEYDANWPRVFAALRAVYAAVLGDLTVEIEHVGSTAVPGLAAKPIIDIDVVAVTPAALPELVERLSRLGYRHNGDQGIAGREALVRDDQSDVPRDGSGRTWPAHNLYVCVAGARELRRHLLFRDWLRADPGHAAEYAALKRKLAERHRHDRDAYCLAKTDFVESALLKADLE